MFTESVRRGSALQYWLIPLIAVLILLFILLLLLLMFRNRGGSYDGEFENHCCSLLQINSIVFVGIEISFNIKFQNKISFQS